jgi:hypothetical protein
VGSPLEAKAQPDAKILVPKVIRRARGVSLSEKNEIRELGRAPVSSMAECLSFKNVVWPTLTTLRVAVSPGGHGTRHAQRDQSMECDA